MINANGAHVKSRKLSKKALKLKNREARKALRNNQSADGEKKAETEAETEPILKHRESVDSGYSSEISNRSNPSPTRYFTKEGEFSIQSCLNKFTAPELMTGNNKVGCEACTERANKVCIN